MSKVKTTKSVLITGCSAGGSGSALAEVFQQRGLHVFATARTISKMSHLKDLPNVTLLELEVTSSQSIAAALEVVKAQTDGKLDYLVNNAGQSMVMPALDTDIDEAKKLFDVNFWGVIATTQAFAPLVIAAKGTIVNICSISGYVNAPWMSKLNSCSTHAVSHGLLQNLLILCTDARFLRCFEGCSDVTVGNDAFGIGSVPGQGPRSRQRGG
jgi:1-acylglycerone phosphate reductase